VQCKPKSDQIAATAESRCSPSPDHLLCVKAPSLRCLEESAAGSTSTPTGPKTPSSLPIRGEMGYLTPNSIELGAESSLTATQQPSCCLDREKSCTANGLNPALVTCRRILYGRRPLSRHSTIRAEKENSGSYGVRCQPLPYHNCTTIESLL
jgi:hypothetical protein